MQTQGVSKILVFAKAGDAPGGGKTVSDDKSALGKTASLGGKGYN